ncbi:ABC transporter substrate-binding protein [Solihabitans fulvus]|uniref:ABC transporter substrate-binding protein n=1 Tax=Solihabitans fulvus TaxID=1892852 RepID=UPI001CB75DD6|nr:ABC transporter substrate-binding protein [Solihabitans fulvus]
MSPRRALVAVLLGSAVLATACTTTATPAADGGKDGTSMVLAAAQEPSTLNPLLGYGEQGASKIYDGLVEHQADRSLRPLLAAELPEPSADGKSWTVKLRGNVKFSDGSPFGAEDVVATYRALLDPAFASPLRDSFGMLASVDQVDATTVRFTLAYPYAPFPDKLVLGIAPRAALAKPAPLAGNELGTKPVGTGPYKLADWHKGEQLVLQANDSYFDGAPKIKKITVIFAGADSARAQRMQAGEFDGTMLPPTLAKNFDKATGMRVISQRSAEYQTVELPTKNAVTGDKAVRLALNYAVNRQSMVDGALAGHGSPAYTPIPEAMPEFFEPTAKFRYDKAEAARLLDQGGWALGQDGVRARGGVPARFTLMYPVDDTVRQGLATSFVADAKAVGIDVQLAGLAWPAIKPRLADDALLLAGGTPFDPDLTAYELLHSSFAGKGFANPGSYADPQVDAALDAGRRTTDPAQRAAAYKQAQRAYVADPGMVFLAFPDHTSVVRDNWTGYQDVVDPHTHGLTWGPWWNVQKWSNK